MVVSDCPVHNRLRYIRSNHCDLKISQFLLTRGKELPKKLRICLCQAKVHQNASFLHQKVKKNFQTHPCWGSFPGTLPRPPRRLRLLNSSPTARPRRLGCLDPVL